MFQMYFIPIENMIDFVLKITTDCFKKVNRNTLVFCKRAKILVSAKIIVQPSAYSFSGH